nr:transposase [Ktedonobacterales bacterium]
MARVRRRQSSEFMVRVVLEALTGQKTLNELASAFGIHPVQITQWKRQASEELSRVFASPGDRQGKADPALIEQHYQEIAQVKVEETGCEKRAVTAGEQREVNVSPALRWGLA